MRLNYLACTLLIAVQLLSVQPFRPRRGWAPEVTRSTGGRRLLGLNMVFDFLRKRSEEGLAQIQNIATKAAEGKLGEALQETSAYVRERNRIDSENLSRMTNGLARSRDRLLSGINGAFGTDDGVSSLDTRLNSLEEVLLQADIGSSTTTAILNDLRSYAKSNRLQVDDILPVLRARLIEALTPNPSSSGAGLSYSNSSDPTVIFVIGANGMGKTTTIGKIAGRLRNEGNLTVLLGACDTFRAAAVEQLGEWAIRANVSIEKPLAEERGGDPVPVVTRSIRRAVQEGFDVVIIDTSGRLSNNFELTQQLQDMKAAIQREIPSAPHETLLVVDGSLGRNAVEQAAAWRKYVGVSGLAITKLDGTARGGFVVSVVRDLGLPVKFIGVGETINDLRDFEPQVFVDALLGNDEKKANMLREKAEKMLGGPGSGLGSGLGSGSMGGASQSASSDAASRLKESFKKSEGAAVASLSESSEASQQKAKRKPRPKPQKRK